METARLFWAKAGVSLEERQQLCCGCSEGGTRPKRRCWSRQSLPGSVCPHHPPADGPKLSFCNPCYNFGSCPLRAASPVCTDLRSVLSQQGLVPVAPAPCLLPVPAACQSSLPRVTVDTLSTRTSPMSFPGRAQDSLHSAHLLPLHTGRESCAARGRNPGEEEGVAPRRRYLLSLRSARFSFFLQLRHPARCGLLHAGSPRAAGRAQGNHVPVPGTALSPCLGLVAFPFL